MTLLSNSSINLRLFVGYWGSLGIVGFELIASLLHLNWKEMATFELLFGFGFIVPTCACIEGSGESKVGLQTRKRSSELPQIR